MQDVVFDLSHHLAFKLKNMMSRTGDLQIWHVFVELYHCYAVYLTSNDQFKLFGPCHALYSAWLLSRSLSFRCSFWPQLTSSKVFLFSDKAIRAEAKDELLKTAEGLMKEQDAGKRWCNFAAKKCHFIEFSCTVKKRICGVKQLTLFGSSLG